MYQGNATLKKLRVVNLRKKADEKMIDREKALKTFNTYVSKYNPEDEKIMVKIEHIQRVAKNANDIAENLKLTREDIDLAWLIGLLHDIGRFEQIKEFNEFNDKKIEHAEFGVKVLFKENLITKFVEDRKYDNIISKAIYNHNKFKIEENLNDIELLHCKIIRDADKIDNFRVKQYDKFEDMFPKIYNNETLNYETVSTKVYEDFMKHKCIKLEDRKTIIDYWVCVIAFIFDLNFDISLKYVQENNYINILVDRIDYKNDDTKQKMEDIRKCAQEYIKKRNEI